MANIETEVREELDKIEEEYAEFMREAQAEIDAVPIVNSTEIHVFNIVLSTIMITIGAILAYQTRNIKLKNGKKIAGWILLILGAIALVSHIFQLLF